MKTTAWTLGAMALAGLLGATSAALGAEIGEITPDDFYGATYYKNAIEHPDLQRLSAKKQMRAIARDMGWKAKKLKAAVAKVETLHGDAQALAMAAIKANLEKGRVKGRVLDVLMNAEEPKHVVVYVRWRGSKSADAVKEASAIAHAVHSGAPLVSTLSLSAIHPKASDDSRASVWSAKIAHTSMERINPKRIEDYAERMYKRLFEGVESKPF